MVPANYTIQRDVLNCVEGKFKKWLTYRWVDYFLRCHADVVCKTTLALQETPRLQVPSLFLDYCIKLIKEYTPLVPTELIVNLDDYSFSDWEERRQKAVLTPAEFQRPVHYYPVNRAIRHQSLICCVTAAGGAYCPLLVSAGRSITGLVTGSI
jgi:hypothetical protein